MRLNLKILVLLFFVSQMFAQVSFARDVKFVQVSDSHIMMNANVYSSRNVIGAEDYLEATIADINTIKDLDFVIFSGDNIDRSNPDDLIYFLKVVNKLKVPYYVVIGNHEVFKSQHFTKKDYMKLVSKYSRSCKHRKPNYVFKKNGTVFIVVDGAKEFIPGPAGYFRKATLAWLDKKLKHYKHSHVVICQHFPLEPPYFNRTHATYDVDTYKNLLAKHKNVVAVISGHYHENGEKEVNGVYHSSCPALLNPPHNYKIIEIEYLNDGKAQIYTQLRHSELYGSNNND